MSVAILNYFKRNSSLHVFGPQTALVNVLKVSYLLRIKYYIINNLIKISVRWKAKKKG